MYAKKEKDRSRLMKAALQEIPCDLTVSNVRYLNIFTGEIYPAQVDILDGVVVRVREEGQETACPSPGELLLSAPIPTKSEMSWASRA